ncbi:MAG: tRNA pseudouridine38-40 synthase [Arcticibacterium sp.]|jgi:tRNA pseudouridine38-40 synthase
MRYFLEITYLGTQYHGWQIQPRESSIQEHIELALSKILCREIRVQGSSRTDTGVHARQQYAHFDIENLNIATGDLKWKLNSFLPNDISIAQILPVPVHYHSRFDALSRSYTYRVNLEKNPFSLVQSLYFRKPLDLDSMNKAASFLLKNNDFQCFSKVRTDVANFNCNIVMAEWHQIGYQLEFRIKANRFLRGMVRAVVGTLIQIGEKKISISEFQHIIDSKDRRMAGSAAKAHGLTLEEVNYPEGYFN